ncbi:MAG: amidohydrolase family protein [Wenzhouxiangellaceae bacterium]|nr:amidohydrolase family protein [Wenzhouxiangellaceae bacterium]MBS3745856.1 amidohydrolase family protein [Wenzhouxiangellaceae bacterium]
MDSIHDPDGTRLPIKLDSTSNGEYEPIPLDAAGELANRMAHEAAGENARRLDRTRRDFLVSSCGAASTLLAFNAANAAVGRTGGLFALADEAALDENAAQAALNGDEFIFDVQGHFVNPTGAWLQHVPEDAKPLSGMPAAGCALGEGPGARSYLKCLGPDAFVKDVFMDSDTDVMVLSFVPSTREGEPLTIEEAAAARDIVASLEGTHRLLLHGRVNPNQAGDVDDMRRLRDDFGIQAWKTYTQWGPDGNGYFLTDADTGIPFLETAKSLDVPVVAIHKGIPFGEQSYRHSLCTDIGPAAKKYPGLSFLIYHSGFVPGQPEGPYDPERNEGIDSLVRTVVEHDLKGGNVYAELGSTWRFLMRDPDSAAHALGKLLKYLGEDNILWGTDSIWYGSPQDQIQAFRAFQISEELQERHGYPALTPEVKRRIFGLNALRPYRLEAGVLEHHLGNDAVEIARAEYAPVADPHYRTFGPKTRREFMNLMRWTGGERA